MYKVIISPLAKIDLDKFDKFERTRVMNRLLKLKTNPYRVSKHLSGHDLWSLKVGRKDYRAIFRVDEENKQVNVYTVEKRKNAYRSLQMFIFR